MNVTNKPIIGVSCGDLNGIGIELIIKTFSDQPGTGTMYSRYLRLPIK